MEDKLVSLDGSIAMGIDGLMKGLLRRLTSRGSQAACIWNKRKSLS